MSDRPGHHEDESSPPQSSSSVKEMVVTVIALVISLVAMATAIFVPLSKKPVATTDGSQTAVVENLRAKVAQLDSTLTYVKAHTDTTGVGDLRGQVSGLNRLVEQRSSDLDELRKDVNHYIINGDARKK